MRIKYQLILVSASAWMCVGALAQASFQLSNRNLRAGVDAPVSDWAGNPLSGPGWRAELYGGLTADALSPAVEWGTGPPGVRWATGFEWPGYFRAAPTAGDLVVWDVPALGWAWLQVRVWDVQLGATYEEAVARGLGGYGASALFYAQGGDPGVYSIPTLPGPLTGLQSFSVLRIVPEPSTWVLLVLGLGGLGWSVRRRSAVPRGPPDAPAPSARR